MIKIILEFITSERILTLIFAWLSALFAWLSFWYSKLAYSRDNAKIKCSVKRMSFFSGNNSTDVMAIKIINLWRRGVKLENIYFDFSNKNWWLIIPNHSPLILPETNRLPFNINESDSFYMCIDYKRFIEQIKSECPWRFIKSLLCWDSIGNIYKGNISYKEFPEICKKRILGIF
jgi:hypothetical protein